MKTGFSRICITPALGVPISGYYEKRQTKGVLDDIFACAIAFDDGKNRALILSVEVCLLSTEQSNKAKKLISKRTGLDENSIFINCSHTHTGPVIEKEFTGVLGNSEYNTFFYDCLVEVSEKSLKDMCISKFSFGEGEAKGISFVRRYRMKNGSVQTNPGVDNPEILNALGTPNEKVKFLKIERENAHTLVIVNFGTHADTVGGEYISGDWPGFVCKSIESNLKNTRCLFLTGSQGDVNHINTNPTSEERKILNYNTFDGVPRSYEYSKFMGEKVALVVTKAFEKTQPLRAQTISYGVKQILIPSNKENHRINEARKICELHAMGKDNELPYEKMELTTVVAEANRICKLFDGPYYFEYSLSALKIGDMALVGLPGECFVDIGREIEQTCNEKNIFVCCLTNGGDTYFPTSLAYDEGGYEARSSILKKGGDKILVQGASELLSKI